MLSTLDCVDFALDFAVEVSVELVFLLIGLRSNGFFFFNPNFWDNSVLGNKIFITLLFSKDFDNNWYELNLNKGGSSSLFTIFALPSMLTSKMISNELL